MTSLRQWALALALLPLAAGAAPATFPLSARNVLAQTHSRAMMFTTTGTFRQLSGTLRYDAARGACDVDVTFVVASLALPNAMIRAKTMSATFLDPAQYPTEHYVAACQGGVLAGALTLRGQTHPFAMTLRLTRSAGAVTAIHAEGMLNRHDWGIDGLGMLVGGTIRVTNDISLTTAPAAP